MATKKFETLDGLRGIAAMAVVFYHLPGPLHDTVPSGYLAVDLFFLMSGFVVAGAYEKRLQDGWQVSGFMLVRLQRLWPLYILGVVLGVACFVSIRLLRPAQPFYFPPNMSMAQVATLSLFFLPQFASYGGPAFPFNSASWSLSVELAGNLAYAMMIRILHSRTLLLLSGIGFLGLAALALKNGNLNVGVMPSNIASGYIRFLFSFPLGVLFYRFHVAGKLPVLSPPAWLPLALVSVFFMASGPLGGMRDVLVVAVGFPAVLLMSLANAVSPRVAKLFVWAGAVSYAAYILHPPLAEAMILMPGGPIYVGASFGLAVAVLLLAALAERYFDRPLQGWLRRRRIMATAEGAAG